MKEPLSNILLVGCGVTIGKNQNGVVIKGVQHHWAILLKTLCIFWKNKANLDKISYGSGYKCSKKLKNQSFTLVQIIIVTIQ